MTINCTAIFLFYFKNNPIKNHLPRFRRYNNDVNIHKQCV